jgi:type II secretory ATPase GspE/PulE/Tfp pilus assembly ATPase PilB-like protein
MSQDARRDEEVATERRARILGLQYSDTAHDNKQLYPEVLTKQELYDLRVIPLLWDPHNVTFGVTNTTSQQTMTNLRNRFLDQRVTFSLISDTGYQDYMQLYDPPKQVVYEDISLKDTKSSDLIERISLSLEQVRADDMLAYIVQQAHRLNASDIHMETQRDHVRIRFRIDGVLHPVVKLSPDKYRILVGAIASAANISTSSQEAQQGHISMDSTMADGTAVRINVRLETVQTTNGMDAVMRLFNMQQDMYNLDRLNLSGAERKIVDDIIAKPSGLVLVVGPTGSGKTTTLYSMLNSLSNEERKIITIEDPVEYHFAGITQISVQSKTAQEVHFADNLRAVLRLDPDIVMVGEIRDNDTAKTALQASLTGHLVLSTFHASSASAALVRMMDVIGQNPLFVSAIRLVMAQRLVRKLDDATKQPAEMTDALRHKLQSVIDTLPEGIPRPDLDEVMLYQPGSSAENPYGFQGQIPLREQFLMTGEIRTLLETASGVLSAQEIETAAVKSGMRTMIQDGVIKVCEGQTTLEEVYRVVG